MNFDCHLVFIEEVSAIQCIVQIMAESLSNYYKVSVDKASHFTCGLVKYLHKVKASENTA